MPALLKQRMIIADTTHPVLLLQMMLLYEISKYVLNIRKASCTAYIRLTECIRTGYQMAVSIYDSRDDDSAAHIHTICGFIFFRYVITDVNNAPLFDAHTGCCLSVLHSEYTCI